MKYATTHKSLYFLISCILSSQSFCFGDQVLEKKGQIEISVHYPEKLLSRIAFGSCLHQDLEQPIWDTLFARNPNLMLMVGDNVYSNPKTISKLQLDYKKAFLKPGYQKLMKDFDVLAVYDDHDFGLNDSGGENPLKDDAAKACLDAFHVPLSDPRRKHRGVYGSYIYGKEHQKVQVIPNERKQECWGNFPHERTRLFQLIESTKAQGVIFLSGDVHFSQMSCFDEFKYPFYEFTSSAMAHHHNTKDGKPTPYSSAANKYRVPDFTYTADSYGEIDIKWQEDKTRITMRMIGVNNTIVGEHSILLESLR